MHFCRFYRFVVEQLVLDKHVRYIVITYPVVIWALSGNLDKNYDAKSPSLNGIFIGKTMRHEREPQNVFKGSAN